jgi:hypothetical protein
MSVCKMVLQGTEVKFYFPIFTVTVELYDLRLFSGVVSVKSVFFQNLPKL